MELWIATGDCGDYYCDGEHLLGIFSNKDLAIEAAKCYATINGTYALTESNPYKLGIVYSGSRREAVVSSRPMLLDEWNSDHVSKEVSSDA